MIKRLEKVLRAAGIKLTSVASQAYSEPARAILDTPAQEERDPKGLASLVMPRGVHARFVAAARDARRPDGRGGDVAGGPGTGVDTRCAPKRRAVVQAGRPQGLRSSWCFTSRVGGEEISHRRWPT
jgi:hypothetical protein